MTTKRKPSPRAARRSPFARDLHGLGRRFHGRAMAVGDLLDATGTRGFHLLLLVLALPFVTPLPMPGFSTPFGLLIALIGGGLALGRHIWLPGRLRAWQVPAEVTGPLFAGAERAARRFSVLLRPRLEFFLESHACRRFAGLLILVCGSLMSLPLPVPLSDGFPAATVSLLAVGTLARDGIFFLAGCAMFGFTLVFFALVALGGAGALSQLHRLLGGG